MKHVSTLNLENSQEKNSFLRLLPYNFTDILECSKLKIKIRLRLLTEIIRNIFREIKIIHILNTKKLSRISYKYFSQFYICAAYNVRSINNRGSE